jgi:hypothetical protein
MYATVRRYKNAGALAAAMSSKSADVKKLISGVSGFVSYYATRDGDTMTSVSIYNDKAGCDESTRVAGEWVRANVKPAPAAPEVSGGEVFLSFSK